MREIKFRAWNDDENKMVRAKLTELENLSIVDERGFSLMQFIGLLDKNGNHIYEGDFLKSYKSDVSMVEWGCFDNLAGFQVRSPFINIFDEKAIEIVGNIFETPELI